MPFEQVIITSAFVSDAYVRRSDVNFLDGFVTEDRNYSISFPAIFNYNIALQSSPGAAPIILEASIKIYDLVF